MYNKPYFQSFDIKNYKNLRSIERKNDDDNRYLLIVFAAEI